MGGLDVHVTLIVPVVLSEWPPSGLSDGPWPIVIPPHDATPHEGTAKVADAAGRESMFGQRGSRVLHDPSKRRYTTEVDAARGHAGTSLIAVEILRQDGAEVDGRALALLHHCDAVDDPVAWASALVSTAKDRTPDALSSLGVPSRVREKARVRHVLHVQTDDVAAMHATWPTTPSSWDPELRALFYLASGGTPSTFAPDDSPSSAPERWALSADWAAMILRDGVAFLPRTTVQESKFHATARALVTSVYLDAFLLALLQLDGATRLADELAFVLEGDLDSEAVLKLEDSLLQFRNRVWWRHVGDRESGVNEILRRAQDQHRVPELVVDISNELSDIARFAEAQERRRRERVTLWVAVVSAVFLVPSLVFTAGASWADPSAGLFWWLLAVSAVLLVAVLASILVIFRPWRRSPGTRRQRGHEHAEPSHTPLDGHGG